MTEVSRLFIDIEPPPGGLMRLQRHMAALHSPPPSRRWRFLATAFATAAVLAGGLWLPGAMSQWHRNAELVQQLRQAVARPTVSIQVIGGAAIEWPSEHANVRIYLVQSGPPSSPTTRD